MDWEAIFWWSVVLWLASGGSWSWVRWPERQLDPELADYEYIERLERELGIVADDEKRDGD